MLAMDKHVQLMNKGERRVVTEPTEVLEDILLDKGNRERFTRSGIGMEEKRKQDLV